jgi:hypothetical protein
MLSNHSVAGPGRRLLGCGYGCGRSDSMFVRMFRAQRWPIGRRARRAASRRTLGYEDAPGDWDWAARKWVGTGANTYPVNGQRAARVRGVPRGSMGASAEPEG